MTCRDEEPPVERGSHVSTASKVVIACLVSPALLLAFHHWWWAWVTRSANVGVMVWAIVMATVLFAAVLSSIYVGIVWRGATWVRVSRSLACFAMQAAVIALFGRG
jgi:MFS superfamily sulfate permease-like transporter